MGLTPVNLKYLIKTFAKPNQVILMCTFNNTANEIGCKVCVSKETHICVFL